MVGGAKQGTNNTFTTAKKSNGGSSSTKDRSPRGLSRDAKLNVLRGVANLERFEGDKKNRYGDFEEYSQTLGDIDSMINQNGPIE